MIDHFSKLNMNGHFSSMVHSKNTNVNTAMTINLIPVREQNQILSISAGISVLIFVQVSKYFR